MKAILSFINLLLLFTIIKCEAEDQKYYFQLDIPQDKDKPYLFYAYTPSSKFITFNTTEKNNCTIIETKKIEQSVTKNLSSIIMYKDLVIKTCFNPNILVEIKNGNIIKKNSKNLSNVKYCYSNAIISPNNQNDSAIITYWIEYELNKNIEAYTHKCILYYINTQVFSHEIILTTESFYSERCITFSGTDIFCSISSDKYTYINYFTIETQKLFKNNNNHLVSSNVTFDKNVYQKIVSTNLRLNIFFYEIFIIEYHNKAKNVTKLNYQLYNKNQNKTLSFKEANYNSPELYIDLFYIEPSLFNMLFQKTNDTIISYIMKVGKKTNYVLSRYNLTKSIEAKNSTLLFSNYLRDDICSNPKYMQTQQITSFINYSEEDKSKIKKNPDDYYKYQRDIVSLITCLNKDNEIEYEPKKIVLPQCLNILDELNNKDFHVINFYNDKNYVVFDIYGDPKYASLRNLDIQFDLGETENKIIINYKEKGSGYKSYGKKDFNIPLRNITHIKFLKGPKMKKNEILRYRLMKSTIDGDTYNCHLSSDICELNFTFIDELSPGGPERNFTNPTLPSQVVCDYTIEGIIFDLNSFECICDVRKGFKREFDEENKVCVCKEGYSYDKNKGQCLPNPGPNTCLDMDNLDLNLWFKLGEYKFYFAKINDCVYIFDDKNLTLFFYSNREDCSFKSEIMIQFIRICLNKPELTGVKEYNVFLDNAKEYDPNATNVTIFKKVEKIEEKDSKIKSILFNLVNGQSQENVSDVILPEHIISEIKNISNISEEFNLLIFKADMARTDTISTQVEYQIYNPIPSKIHQKIKFIITNITNDTNLRRLDDDDDGTTIYIFTDKFDVKLNLPQDWSDDELDIIEELWHQKHIFIFDSSNPFFLDVCYKFTTSYNADIYLQDRKEKYYIQHPFCEEGCDLIDTHNYESNKMTCQCNLKIINDNYTNASFYEIEPVEEFKKKYTFPNIKVMGCISKIKIFQAAITIFNLIFFVSFCITHRIRKCYNKDHNMFISLVDNIEEELNIFKKYHGIKDDKEKKKKN